jgi:hypothetical protein
MRTLVEQVNSARRRTGSSMAELLRRSGLKLHQTTLRRKLVGDGRKARCRTGLRTEECEALARALGVTLVVIPPEVEDEDHAS